MVLPQVAEVLEKRKSELIDMLENNRDSLELEKQHQIYGAINELELFLHTLSYYEANGIENDSPVKLVKAPERNDVIGKIFQGIKSKVIRNSARA
jgi:hypothetical protein